MSRRGRGQGGRMGVGEDRQDKSRSAGDGIEVLRTT